MKKLIKLNINPEKVIKNEELVSLRGGYEAYFNCSCSAGSIPPYPSTWCIVYSSWLAMEGDINIMCIGGEGTCNFTESCE